MAQGKYIGIDRFTCSCHARMGNDFYFLPVGHCLHGECDRSKYAVETSAMIDGRGKVHVLPLLDPIRGGVLT